MILVVEAQAVAVLDLITHLQEHLEQLTLAVVVVADLMFHQLQVIIKQVMAVPVSL
jgi:hypothetical protein